MRIAPALLAAAALAAMAAPALACSCGCPADAATLAREVPMFFRGRPVSETVAGQARHYAFEVSVVHKGTVAGRVIVETQVHGVACGVRFPLDQEALVGAYPGKAWPRANQCTQFCIGQKREELERILARCTPGAPCPPDS